METKDLQNAILKVGKELHRICIENNIKYAMVGRTLLGAIRHQGFIPWDDDMDIGMTWDEYNKFISKHSIAFKVIPYIITTFAAVIQKYDLWQVVKISRNCMNSTRQKEFPMEYQ